MNYPSKHVEDAVNEISKLPGIGKKSAMRLVLHLLKQDLPFSTNLANSIIKLKTQTQFCADCNNISDQKLCEICLSKTRDRSIICVVEDTRDVIAIENTSQYKGLYHVLGGVISPINGIGPSELKIQELIVRAGEKEVNEVIMAINPTMEGDTTAFYIHKKLKEIGKKVTSIARGVPIGGELEYTDEITLGRSIVTRINYLQD